MKCKMCGTEIIPVKHAWNKIYCSLKCRNKRRQISRRPYLRRYMRKWRERHNKLYLGTELSDTSIIKVNGEERIKGRITLDRIIRQMKEEDGYCP